MTLIDYLTAAGRTRLARRRDAALISFLQRHPHTELPRIATGVRRPLLATHRNLERLETEGRVRSTLMDGPVFYTTVYEAAPAPRPQADASAPAATPRTPAPRTAPHAAQRTP